MQCVGIAAQEFGREAIVDAKHVVGYQNLAVDTSAGSDAYYGNSKLRCYSCEGNSKEALASAIRIMKESHAEAVKIEGGAEIRESIERILCVFSPRSFISISRLVVTFRRLSEVLVDINW